MEKKSKHSNVIDYHSLFIPKKYWYVPIKQEEGEFIYNFLLKNKSIKKSLEIGFGCGVSSIYIMSAKKGQHTTIDSYQNKQFNNLGIHNLKQFKLYDRCRYYNDLSHNVLPFLLSKKERFDFVFIDGGHKYDEIFVDFYYVDLLLNQGGYVIFHDNTMRSTQMVASWIMTNKKNYYFQKISEKNMILLKKVGNDNRKWSHFNEFYTVRYLILHFYLRIKNLVFSSY